jgi:hypothetical protein
MQQPFQVVLVASLPCPGDVAGSECLLGPIEQTLGDERLVLALVPSAAPLHDPDVERVGEELGELGDRDRRARSPRVRRREPLRVHRRLQLGQRILAGRVQPEGLPDEQGPLRVQDHLSDLLAGDLLPDVQVADRCLGRPAAHLGLLGHALSDLTGEVRRVELGHQRVDALNEASGGRLLDVLGHRDQLHPGVAERRSDGHMVLHGAGQPIDLVDNDSPDAALGHPAKERL